MGKQFEFSRARSFVCEEVVSLKYQRKVNRQEGGEGEKEREREIEKLTKRGERGRNVK